jgi:serine/threonine protein kinase
MERLEFTMTAFIRAAGRVHLPPKDIIAVLKTLLDLLHTRNLVYGDLSPDNIMFRRVDDVDFQIVLIDPQFMASRQDFSTSTSETKAKAFDTTYLALKIQAIGMLDPAVHKFTDAVCAGILGHVPLEKYTKRWLTHEAPVGLFMAYDVLRKKSSN